MWHGRIIKRSEEQLIIDNTRVQIKDLCIFAIERSGSVRLRIESKNKRENDCNVSYSNLPSKQTKPKFSIKKVISQMNTSAAFIMASVD